jgi:hypothetical protein
MTSLLVSHQKLARQPFWYFNNGKLKLTEDGVLVECIPLELINFYCICGWIGDRPRV